MKYLCLVYQDESVLKGLSRGEYDALVQETREHKERLVASGRLVDSNALSLVDCATSVRLRDGRAIVTDGPFVETKEQVGGYFLIEARDLNDAIRIAASLPPARLGGVEVRPLHDLMAAEGP